MLPCLPFFLLTLLASPSDRDEFAPAPPDHPYVRAATAFRMAREERDQEALAALLSDDSRIWFETKEGPGRPRQESGEGPWAAWDTYFRSQTEVLSYEVAGDQLRMRLQEINDWMRLVERVPHPYFVSYFFDGDGRIAGTLIQADPDAPPKQDQLDVFTAWAREHRPGLIEELLPGGEIDPALPLARRWRKALIEWRAATGRTPLELGDPPPRD